MDSTLSIVLIKKPWLLIPSGYVCPAFKLALHLCIISFTSISVSKLLPCKNCCDPWKRLPVYHTPPPLVIPEASKDPVVAIPKLEVDHFVPVISLSLKIQEHPFELVGKFENLPVPSSHDWETANTSKFKVFAKF